LSRRRDLPFNAGEVGGEISLQRPPPPSWCKSLYAGGRERGCRFAGRPLHDIYTNLTLQAPPPWADKPEEAGIGRWLCVPLRREAVGRLQNAAGRSAEICTKPPWNM